MEFDEVVMYAALAGSISLSRVDLKDKVNHQGCNRLILR
jgi:hypothetical protein